MQSEESEKICHDLLNDIPDEAINSKYVSTRGAAERDFWESVVTGVDEKGGLLMPEKQFRFPENFLEKLPYLEINEISAYVLRNFIPREDIEDKRLCEMMQIAHDFDLPLEILDDSTFVLRLDQGPTASFKDIAARALAQLMEAHCEKYQKQLNLIVATSGDTGVAIADAFGDSKWVTVTVMYPTDGVSPPQEKQMLDAAAKYDNVQMLPMKGNFDNSQDISKILQMIKNLDKLDQSEMGMLQNDTVDFNENGIQEIIGEIKVKLQDAVEELGIIVDEQYVLSIAKVLKDIDLGSANSISWWRLAPQIVQYAAGIGKAQKEGMLEEGESVVYAVPSGNVGHLTAGLIGQEAGLPIKKFIVGTNSNNVLKGLINEGVIRHPGFQGTASPSMDIGDPNNFERILCFAAKEVGFEGEIDYKRIKNDITRFDNKIKKLRKGIDNLKENKRAEEGVEILRQELNDALNDCIDLRYYGVNSEMLTFLQDMIVVEDVVSDEETYAMMTRTAQKTGVVMEPHGITAKIATDRARAKKIVGENDKVIILETAHPDKFPEALKEAFLDKKAGNVLCFSKENIDLKTFIQQANFSFNNIISFLREDVDLIEFAQQVKHPFYYTHSRLKELSNKSLDEMNKPDPLELNILEVAKKIRDIAVLNQRIHCTNY